ncbi:hypothetical protein [Nocardiopsis sp. MG754419]|uniref:hypothetical protein n=1 Tax=Nocardiopsis sp. MG754419 TaxID=2259865 RepID=UPI002013713C|nr:hypothetical protein [Nocardiopsis sp. MG754419]
MNEAGTIAGDHKVVVITGAGPGSVGSPPAGRSTPVTPWSWPAAVLMRDQEPHGGRIIDNGSVPAHVPGPSSVACTVSEHAVSGLTASLDLRGHGIAGTRIDIGNAATAMTSGFGANARQADGAVRPAPTIDAAHVAELIAHIVALPLEVGVPTLMVMARETPFAGRG